MFESKDEPLLLDFSIPLFRDSEPLQIVGPVPGNPAAIRQFTNLADWRSYVLGLQLRGSTPKVFRRKHNHVLRTLFLAWLDANVIKLAELGGLAMLEGAIRARYPEIKINKKQPGLECALTHLVEHGGLNDDALRETGARVSHNILPARDKGGRRLNEGGSSLSNVRNRLAHGDPFEVMPWGGLFEVIRDLVDFMYPAPEKGGMSGST
ncbi:MAG TPA: hypothetical protein VFZ27_12540 [Terriglobia bacterium]|nr:hypothetical protein [Terriglobia bacterium]